MLKIIECKTYAEALRKAGERASRFEKSPSKRLFAFCEDKLTMSLEREVAIACGGGTFNVQVTSFNRFIKRNARVSKSVLDKEASAMVVKNILLEKRDELICFKKSAYNPGTAVTLYELIAQLKSAGVSIENISSGAEGLEGALKGKIDDVITVYTAYEKYIEDGGYLDSNSYLSLMPTLLRQGNFDGCSAMLVGFSSLTKQGLEIVKALSERMEDLDVYLLLGENNQFYTNELKCALMRDIEGFSVEESTDEYSEERKKIMNCLFDPQAIKTPATESDSIFIYDAVDFEDEIKHVATLIRREILSGKRYKDIALALGNPSEYRTIVFRVFGDYDIPYFFDDPRVLSSHPLARLTISFLDMLKSFRPQEICAFEKNPYFQPDRDVSDRFENFIKKYAITAKVLKNGLNLTKTPKEVYGEDCDLFINERERIIACLKDCKTVREFVQAIRNLIKQCKAEELSLEHAKRLVEYGDHAGASFTKQAHSKIDAVLKSVENVLGNQNMSVVDFRNVLLSGYTACKISVIPQLSDSVYVGDYKECKYIEHDVLFAAGLSGEVPFAKSDTAVLTDKDLVKLEGYGCIVEPKIKIVNRREKENVGSALVSFGKKLYLSSSSIGTDGKAASRSRILQFFKDNFTHNGEKLRAISAVSIRREREKNPSLDLAMSALEYNSPRPSMAKYIGGAIDFKNGSKVDFSAETAYFSALSRILPSEAEEILGFLERSGTGLARELKKSGELIFNKDTISASILEKYFACPFACFMQYGLKLKEREEGEVKPNEYGNFLHAVLEKYVKILCERIEGDTLKPWSKEESNAVTQKIVEELLLASEYSRYLETDKYKVIFAYVNGEAKRVCYNLYLQFKNSSFRPVATEAYFGDGGKYKAIKLNTSYGEKKINGKIDRVDKYGDYVRIVDYKTGDIYEKDEEFFTGNRLQLFLYMNAFLKDGEKAGGAYYFPVTNGYEEKDSPIYAMKGKTIFDSHVISAMDAGISPDSPQSSAIDVKIKYSGDKMTKTYNANKLIEKDVFDSYLKYAILIAQKGAEEIADGVIAVSPYKGKCEYCSYCDICGFEDGIDKNRKENEVTSNTIFKAVEVEDGLH